MSDEAAFFRESISGQNEREDTCLLQSWHSTDVLPAVLAHAINLFEWFLSVINHCKPAMCEILK